MKNSIYSIILIALIGLNASCDKFRDNRNAEATVDVALAESSFLDVSRIAFNAGALMEGALSNIDSCAILTFQNAIGTFPNTVTVEYPSQCEGLFNFKRSGKVVLTYNMPLSQQGATVQIILENFSSSDHQVEGTAMLSNKGFSGNNSLFELSVVEGSITSLREEIVTWNAIYLLERTIGENTLNFIWDDVFLLTGGSSGVNSNDVKYTSEITEALTWDITCRWVSKGVAKVKPDGRKDNEINYGDTGICDNRARVSVGDNKKNATLK